MDYGADMRIIAHYNGAIHGVACSCNHVYSTGTTEAIPLNTVLVLARVRVPGAIEKPHNISRLSMVLGTHDERHCERANTTHLQ